MHTPFLLFVTRSSGFSDTVRFHPEESTLEDLPARIAPRNFKLVPASGATRVTLVDRETTDDE